jgi:hypothetical protein
LLLSPPDHVIITQLAAECRLKDETIARLTSERHHHFQTYQTNTHNGGIIFQDARLTPKKTFTQFCFAYAGCKMDDYCFPLLHLLAVKGTQYEDHQLVLITIESDYKISVSKPEFIIDKYNSLLTQPEKRIVPSFQTLGRDHNMSAVCKNSLQLVAISKHILDDEESKSAAFWSWEAQTSKSRKRTREN